jgi:hypothetical protein
VRAPLKDGADHGFGTSTRMSVRSILRSNKRSYGAAEEENGPLPPFPSADQFRRVEGNDQYSPPFWREQLRDTPAGNRAHSLRWVPPETEAVERSLRRARLADGPMERVFDRNAPPIWVARDAMMTEPMTDEAKGVLDRVWRGVFTGRSVDWLFNQALNGHPRRAEVRQRCVALLADLLDDMKSGADMSRWPVHWRYSDDNRRACEIMWTALTAGGVQ